MKQKTFQVLKLGKSNYIRHPEAVTVRDFLSPPETSRNKFGTSVRDETKTQGMDIKKIQELIKLVKKTDISELTVKEGENTISIKNKGNETFIAAPAVPQVTQVVSENQKSETPTAQPKNENLITFRSPMVGTFYRKPGADKEPFVKVGDAIKSGDTLCIIEAMKLFNEIEFDGSAGKIVKILAEDSSPVEYDQPLFLIEKS